MSWVGGRGLRIGLTLTLTVLTTIGVILFSSGTEQVAGQTTTTTSHAESPPKHRKKALGTSDSAPQSVSGDTQPNSKPRSQVGDDVGEDVEDGGRYSELSKCLDKGKIHGTYYFSRPTGDANADAQVVVSASIYDPNDECAEFQGLHLICREETFIDSSGPPFFVDQSRKDLLIAKMFPPSSDDASGVGVTTPSSTDNTVNGNGSTGSSAGSGQDSGGSRDQQSTGGDSGKSGATRKRGAKQTSTTSEAPRNLAPIGSLEDLELCSETQLTAIAIRGLTE